MKKYTCCISLFLGEFDMESSDLHDLVLLWDIYLVSWYLWSPVWPALFFWLNDNCFDVITRKAGQWKKSMMYNCLYVPCDNLKVDSL